MRDKSLYLIAIVGIIFVSFVDLTASFDSGMLIGTLFSWIPYLAVVIIRRSFNSLSKLTNSLKGGLLMYLAIDLFVRYQALHHHHPNSSTDAVAVMIILIGSVIIIPVGVGITYLLLSIINYGNQG